MRKTAKRNSATPGECIDIHRHMPRSVYQISSGYSTIDQSRIEWQSGNMLTIQDLPAYAYNRMVSFQASDSDKSLFLHEPG